MKKYSNNKAGKLNKKKVLPTRFPMYQNAGITAGASNALSGNTSMDYFNLINPAMGVLSAFNQPTPEMYFGTNEYFDKQNQIAGQAKVARNAAAQGLNMVVPGAGSVLKMANQAGQFIGQKDQYGLSPTGFQQTTSALLDPVGSLTSLAQGQNPYSRKQVLKQESNLITDYNKGKTAEQQDAYMQQMKAAEGQYMAMGGYMPKYYVGGINPMNPPREYAATWNKDVYNAVKGNYGDYGFNPVPGYKGYYKRDNEYFNMEPTGVEGSYGMYSVSDPTLPTPKNTPTTPITPTTQVAPIKKPEFKWKLIDPWDLEKRYNDMAKKGMIDIKEEKGKTYIKRNYAMGGRMVNPYTGQPNAEIEGEVVSHSNGGIQDFSHLPNHEQATSANEVNLAEGSKILSKRITDPLTGKKFATVGKKYSTSREENVLNNTKLPEISTKSAQLSLAAKKKAFDDVFERHEATKLYNGAQKAENEATEDFIGMLGGMYGKGGLIKRKDGSYSPRGLWDNIRANKGSGKAPTKAMLEQERKIKAQEKAYGGYMNMYEAGGYALGESYDISDAELEELQKQGYKFDIE